MSSLAQRIEAQIDRLDPITRDLSMAYNEADKAVDAAKAEHDASIPLVAGNEMIHTNIRTMLADILKIRKRILHAKRSAWQASNDRLISLLNSAARHERSGS